MVTRNLSYGLGDDVHIRRSLLKTIPRAMATYIAFLHAACALKMAVQQYRDERSLIARSDGRCFSNANGR